MRQFYGRLEKCVLSAGKTHAHKIPRFLGGIWGFFGGGGVPILFYGRKDFSDKVPGKQPKTARKSRRNIRKTIVFLPVSASFSGH